MPSTGSVRDGRDEGSFMMKIIGLALIVLGVLAFVFQGITYTTDEKVVDVGPLEITAEREKSIPLPPILGGIALVGGIVLVAASGKKK